MNQISKKLCEQYGTFGERKDFDGKTVYQFQFHLHFPISSDKRLFEAFSKHFVVFHISRIIRYKLRSLSVFKSVLH